MDLRGGIGEEVRGPAALEDEGGDFPLLFIDREASSASSVLTSNGSGTGSPAISAS